MKITGGKFKGRILKSPKGIRPAQSKVRKAIFDTLQNIKGKKILDVFAGSGSLGFEALSRGAKSCIFVDRSKSCIRTIKENARSLGVEKEVRILGMDFKEFLKINREKFDIIFIDPPYRLMLKGDEIVKFLKILKKRGVMIMETKKEIKFDDKIKNLILKEVSYGQTKITYFTCCLSWKF